MLLVQAETALVTVARAESGRPPAEDTRRSRRRARAGCGGCAGRCGVCRSSAPSSRWRSHCWRSSPRSSTRWRVTSSARARWSSRSSSWAAITAAGHLARPSSRRTGCDDGGRAASLAALSSAKPAIDDEFHAITTSTSRTGSACRRSGTYLRELWRRREFAFEMSRTRLRAQHFNTALGQLWLLLNPLLLTCVYFVLVDILRAEAGGSVFFAHLMAGLFAYNFVSGLARQAVKSVTAAAGWCSTRRSRASCSRSRRCSWRSCGSCRRCSIFAVVRSIAGCRSARTYCGRCRSRRCSPCWHGAGDARRARCRSTSATSRASCPTGCGSGSTPRRSSTTPSRCPDRYHYPAGAQPARADARRRGARCSTRGQSPDLGDLVLRRWRGRRAFVGRRPVLHVPGA